MLVRKCIKRIGDCEQSHGSRSSRIVPLPGAVRDRNLCRMNTMDVLKLESLEIPTASGPVRAEVKVPGSKSLTNRALLTATLAEGKSRLSGCLHSVDTEAMMMSLRALGVAITPAGETNLAVVGSAGRFAPFDGTLNCVNAGTATRFLTAAMSIVPGTQIVDGNARMRERPIQDLVDALKPLGVEIDAPSGCPPVTVSSSKLRGGKTTIPGHISSQFLSAVLLVSPYAEEPVAIEVSGDLVSIPYVDLTLDVMHAFGARAANDNYKRFEIQPSRYTGREYAVEPDISSACYWFALAAATAGRITVRGVKRNSRQADIRLLDVLERMGAKVISEPDAVTVIGPERLKAAGTLDMHHFSDQVMTAAVLAALADGTTTISNVEVVRHKETDRIAATATELSRTGIQVEEHPDGLTIVGGVPKAAEIHTYDDHRMAMSFSILGTRTPGTVILDPGCTAKTYPTFFDRLLPILEKE